MKRNNSIISLTFFTTALITTVVFIIYLMLLSEINSDLSEKGLGYVYTYMKSGVVFIIVLMVGLAYLIGSIIIDKIMNPIRLMILRVKDIGNMNFSKPLTIDSDDDELKEYAVAFNDMSQKLNSYIERQKRFISDASHELTTPITIINGHSDLLIRWGKEHPEILDSELKIIKREALRMSELIDSLLILARSDNGKQSYTFEKISFNDLVKESVEEFKISAPDFKFNIIMEDNFFVKCDEYAIKRVFRIILSNAIRYSDTSKFVTIKAYGSVGLVNVSIRDKGIGISEEHLPYIFDRFYRVDESRSKKTGSSGLGLAIAKEIINFHGGEIKVMSKKEYGSEFSFIIPSL